MPPSERIWNSSTPTLLPERLHGEVLAQSGLSSGRADLLAISREGRLTVLELKAGEDIHLPLQALDYWMRIAWHSRTRRTRQLISPE